MLEWLAGLSPLQFEALLVVTVLLTVNFMERRRGRR